MFGAVHLCYYCLKMCVLWKPGNPEENHIEKVEEDVILMKHNIFPKWQDFRVNAHAQPLFA